MALDFPNNPAVNDVYNSGNNSFVWDGTKWRTNSGALVWLVGTGLQLDLTTDPDTIKLQVPVSIANGGTGSTTQQGAQTALGGPFLPLLGGTLSANTGTTPVIPVGTVLQVVGANATSARITIDGFGAPVLLTMRYANGTMATPSIVTNNNILGGVYVSGYATSGYSASPVGIMHWYATENWSASAQGTGFQISTTKSGTTQLATMLYIDGGGVVNFMNGFSSLGQSRVVFADNTGYQFLVAGGTVGVRIFTNSAQARIDGVDQTGVGSFQPLAIYGNPLTLGNATTVNGILTVSSADIIGGANITARDTVFARPADTTQGYTVMVHGDASNAGYFAAFKSGSPPTRSFYLGYRNDGGTDFICETGRLNLQTPTDGFRFNVPNGGAARIFATVNGTRTWSYGVYSDGQFMIADESATTVRMQIDTNGVSTFSGPVTINSTSISALQIANGGNIIRITGTNPPDLTYPSIRTDGVNLVLNSSNSGQIYIGNDANYRNIQFKGSTYNGQGHYPNSNNVANVGVAGQAWASMASYAFANQSSRNDKKEIQEAPAGALAKVKALRSVIFRWKDHPIINHFTHERSEEPGPIHQGFIADEVAQVFGEDWGGYQKVGEHESIHYADLVSVLWKAVQELAFELEVLRANVRGAR